MANANTDGEKATKTAGTSEPTFTKAQIVGSVKYKKHRDLVSAALDDTKNYTFTEVDKIIDQYKKGVIK